MLQGSEGIPNDNIQNYPFFRLQLVFGIFDTQPNEPINQNSVKVPKVVQPTYKKTL